MKNYTNEEILNGLEMIRNICKNHSNCDSCPFENPKEGLTCMFTSSSVSEVPEKWELNFPAGVWKAFI